MEGSLCWSGTAEENMLSKGRREILPLAMGQREKASAARGAHQVDAVGHIEQTTVRSNHVTTEG
jgi:hypothetical protein